MREKHISSLPTEEEIARIIDPTHFSMLPKHYGLKTQDEFRRTFAFGAQLAALEKARAILALFANGQPPETKTASDVADGIDSAIGALATEGERT